MNSNKLEYYYKELPKTLAPDDYWGQVRRTVQGKPVSDEQIRMIVEAIKTNMDLNSSDSLLDIACGNGALSSYFFDTCKEYLGVDFSEYLIEVGKKNFERLPAFEFRVGEAVEYTLTEKHPERFTKALCYGSFSYLTSDNAHTMLNALNQRFTNLNLIYIGNLPDKERANLFYPYGTDFTAQLDDPYAPVGIWRSKEEFSLLATRSGWKVKEFFQMPKEFYASHYRFDVLLVRKDK